MEFETYIRTRHYELDSSVHINNANYLRYLEEARVQMMEKLNFPIREVYEANIQMILYKYVCNFKKQTRFPEELIIRSKQIQVKKLRGILRQEIYNSKKELCFSADAYWAYYSPDKSLLNKCIEFAKRFGGDEVSNETTYPNYDFDLSKIDREPNFKSIEIQVRPYEIDSFQHVNNAVYANYFEIGRWKFREEVLGDIQFFKKLNLSFVLYKSEINFIDPALNFEELELKTYLINLSKTRVVYYQRLFDKKGVLKSDSYSDGCLVDKEDRVSKLPDSAFENYAKYLIT
jgi:acyl-CoA thioester hydrolase